MKVRNKGPWPNMRKQTDVLRVRIGSNGQIADLISECLQPATESGWDRRMREGAGLRGIVVLREGVASARVAGDVVGQNPEVVDEHVLHAVDREAAFQIPERDRAAGEEG